MGGCCARVARTKRCTIATVCGQHHLHLFTDLFGVTAETMGHSDALRLEIVAVARKFAPFVRSEMRPAAVVVLDEQSRTCVLLCALPYRARAAGLRLSFRAGRQLFLVQRE